MGSLSRELPGRVAKDNDVAALPQQSRRRRQTEGLPPQLVGGNENDVHANTSIAARRLDSISVIIEGYASRRKDCKNGHQCGQFFPHTRQAERWRSDLRYSPPRIS